MVTGAGCSSTGIDSTGLSTTELDFEGGVATLLGTGSTIGGEVDVGNGASMMGAVEEMGSSITADDVSTFGISVEVTGGSEVTTTTGSDNVGSGS